MKKTLASFALLGCLFIIASCGSKGKNGVTYKDARQYNDYIVNKQMALQKRFEAATASLASVSNADEMKAGATKLIQSIDSTLPSVDKDIVDVQGMPDWNGDTAMRGAAVQLFTFYHSVLDKDLRDMGNLLAKGADFSTADQQKMEEINTRINTSESKLDDQFRTAQKQFATKNKLVLY
ncbi:MAG: hypothetical protein J0I41_15225 [Filimonas sp.]|nr:hypothetical protein [Filimonas sp.]